MYSDAEKKRQEQARREKAHEATRRNARRQNEGHSSGLTREEAERLLRQPDKPREPDVVEPFVIGPMKAYYEGWDELDDPEEYCEDCEKKFPRSRLNDQYLCMNCEEMRREGDMKAAIRPAPKLIGQSRYESRSYLRQQAEEAKQKARELREDARNPGPHATPADIRWKNTQAAEYERAAADYERKWRAAPPE